PGGRQRGDQLHPGEPQGIRRGGGGPALARRRGGPPGPWGEGGRPLPGRRGRLLLFQGPARRGPQPVGPPASHDPFGVGRTGGPANVAGALRLSRAEAEEPGPSLPEADPDDFPATVRRVGEGMKGEGTGGSRVVGRTRRCSRPGRHSGFPWHSVCSAGPAAELVVRQPEAEGQMGLFDWFRKPKPAVPLPQLCYDVAYFILPHYAFRDLAKLTDLCLNTPTAAGPFFYVMAAQARKVEPDPEDAKRFRWHHGQ